MSNNNVIYSKTLELRSNNRGDCSLESFGGAGNKMGRGVAGGRQTSRGLEERKLSRALVQFCCPKGNEMHFVMIYI